jgi:hypothetical protein
MKEMTTKISLWLSDSEFKKYEQTDSSQHPHSEINKRKLERSRLNLEKVKSEARVYFEEEIGLYHKENFRMALRELEATCLEEIIFGNCTDEVKSDYRFPDDDIIHGKLDSLLEEYPLVLPEKDYFQSFKEIFKVTKLIRDFIEGNNDNDDSIAFLNAFKILVLFGSLKKFDEFLKEHSFLKTPKPVTKALEFTIPHPKAYGVISLGVHEQDDPWAWAKLPPARNIHLDEWRKIIAKSGPKAYPDFTLAIPTEQVLNGKAPKSVEQAREAMKPYQYRKWEKDPELADVFLGLRISESNFGEVLRLKKTTKKYSNIPDLIIKGEKVNQKYKDYFLVKLPVDDPRFYVIGHLTACCQSIDSDAGKFVRMAAQDPNIDVYVLLKRDRKKKTKDSKEQDPQVFKDGQIDYKNFKIMGQGMVWLSERGNVTIDSWENLNPEAEDPIIVDMLPAFGKELVAQGKAIRLTIGSGGKTPKFLKDKERSLISERSLSGIQYKDSSMQIEIYCDEEINKKNLIVIKEVLIDYLGEDFVTMNPQVVDQFGYDNKISEIVECKIPGIKKFFHNRIKKNDLTTKNNILYKMPEYFKTFFRLEKHLTDSIWQYLELCDPGILVDRIDPLILLLNEIHSHGDSVSTIISNKFIEKILFHKFKTFTSEEVDVSVINSFVAKYKTFIKLKLHEEKQAERLADFILGDGSAKWLEKSNLIPDALEKLKESKVSEHSDLRLEILKFPQHSAELIDVFQQFDQSGIESFNHYCDFLFRNSRISDKTNQIKLLKKWLAVGLHSHAGLLNSESFSGPKSYEVLSKVIDRCEMLSKLEITIDSKVLALLVSLDQSSFEERIRRLQSFKQESQNYRPAIGNILFTQGKVDDSCKLILNSDLPNIEKILSLMLENPEKSRIIARSFMAIYEIGPAQYAEFTQHVEESKTYDPEVGTVLSLLHKDRILFQGDENIFSFVLNLPVETLKSINKNYLHVGSMKEFLNSPDMKAIIGESAKNKLKIHEFLLGNFGELKDIQAIFAKEPIKNPHSFMEFMFSKGHPPVSEIGNMIKRHNQLQTLKLSSDSARKNFLVVESKTLDQIFRILKPYRWESNSMVLDNILNKIPGEVRRICQQEIKSHSDLTVILFRKIYGHMVDCSNDLSKKNLSILNALMDSKDTDLFATMDKIIIESESAIKIWEFAKKYSGVSASGLFHNLLINSVLPLMSCQWPFAHNIRLLNEIFEQGMSKPAFESDAKAVDQFCTDKINASCTQTILKFRKVFQALHVGSRRTGPGLSEFLPILTGKSRFTLEDFKAVEAFVSGETSPPIVKMAWETAIKYIDNFENNMGMFKTIYAWGYHNNHTLFRTGNPNKVFTVESVQTATSGRTHDIYRALNF